MKKKSTVRLTNRDLDLLDSLGDYRFLSVPQLSALHFPSSSAATARLRALVNAGLAIRVFMPVRPHDRSATSIYALAAKGAALLAPRHEGTRPPWVTPANQRSALFLDHTLRRGDLRVCLELLDRDRTGFHFLGWKQKESDVRLSVVLEPHRREPRRVTVIPDGFFAVRWRGEIQAFCVEIDMGTVNKSRMSERYRAYWRLWKEGKLARKFGNVPMRVVTLTTTPSRLESLRRLAIDAPGPGHRGTGLFWFAPLGAADIRAPDSLLGHAWRPALTNPGPDRPLLQ